jgi:hypothetical protein
MGEGDAKPLATDDERDIASGGEFDVEIFFSIFKLRRTELECNALVDVNTGKIENYHLRTREKLKIKREPSSYTHRFFLKPLG